MGATCVLPSVSSLTGHTVWLHLCSCKGQLISKCLFGVFTFFQKTNENKSTSSKVKFVRSFFGRNIGLKKSFWICLTFNTLGYFFEESLGFSISNVSLCLFVYASPFLKLVHTATFAQKLHLCIFYLSLQI